MARRKKLFGVSDKVDAQDQRGPSFIADWGAECSRPDCLEGEFDEGDSIRADGEGGYECASHKEEDEEDG